MTRRKAATTKVRIEVQPVIDQRVKFNAGKTEDDPTWIWSFAERAPEPEREHYDLFVCRDNTVIAYRTSMELERKYLAMYGKHPATLCWAYELPAGVEVHG